MGMGSAERRCTEGEVVAALRAVGEAHGRWLTGAQWDAKGCSPSRNTVLQVCGTWSRAWRSAGFAIPDRWLHQRAKPWTDEDMLRHLRLASEALGGRFLSGAVYSRWHKETGQGPCEASYVRRFRTWERARRLAGLKVDRAKGTPEQVFWFTASLWKTLGHPPSRAEWERQEGKPCSFETAQRITGDRLAVIRKKVLAAHPELSTAKTRSTALQGLLDAPQEALTPREREIVRMAKMGTTLQGIGDQMGLTRERVRQIAKRAVARIDRKQESRRKSRGGPHRTNEQILDLLRRRFADLGYIPTVVEWGRGRESPSFSTIVARFGSWRTAWAAALGEDHPEVQLLKRGRKVRVPA